MVGDMKGYGFEVEKKSFSWNKLKQGRDAYIKRLNGIYERNLANSGITSIHGWAKFVEGKPNTVEVEGKEYSGDHVLIATGGRPKIPKIPGAGYGITSDEFFDLEEMPERPVVVGAGYIAVELAGIFNALGTQSTLVCRHEK